MTVKIGDKIGNLMKDNKMSLREFCFRNEFTYTTIVSQLKNNSPNYEFLKKLYETYPYIDMNWLFGENDKDQNINTTNPKQVIENIIQQLNNLKQNLDTNLPQE